MSMCVSRSALCDTCVSGRSDLVCACVSVGLHKCVHVSTGLHMCVQVCQTVRHTCTHKCWSDCVLCACVLGSLPHMCVGQTDLCVHVCWSVCTRQTDQHTCHMKADCLEHTCTLRSADGPTHMCVGHTRQTDRHTCTHKADCPTCTCTLLKADCWSV